MLLVLVTAVIQDAHAVLRAPVVDNEFLAEERYELAYTNFTNSLEKIYSAEYFEETTGRKPKIHERLALKILHRKVRHKLKKLATKIETYNSTDCDLIVLKNGDEIEAKVVEITTNKIKYNKCDNLNGPIYSLDKSQVFVIKYVNGTKEVISTPAIADAIDNNEPNDSNSDRDTPYDPYDDDNTLGAYFGGFILGLITLPLGLLFGLFIGNEQKRKAYYEGWYAALGIYIIIALIALLA